MMMRKAMAAVAAAGALLLGAGAATASPASAATWLLVCDPNLGQTLVNGVCVLPGGNLGQSYLAEIEAGNYQVDYFTVTSGTLPPGTAMPAKYGNFGTIVATPTYKWLTQQGTFTFTLNAFAPDGTSAQLTYSVTVGPPLPLTITSPSTMYAGTVGQQYYGYFSYSGACRHTPGRWSPGSSRPASR
jgi:hypothetical protein